MIRCGARNGSSTKEDGWRMAGNMFTVFFFLGETLDPKIPQQIWTPPVFTSWLLVPWVTVALLFQLHISASLLCQSQPPAVLYSC